MATTAAAPLTNVLAKSKSPYLLQHKDNPVAWQEFTPETIALARQLDKPIFLSSGYSACHWCHVLAHESFENEPIARAMNDAFVNIKVDREERPDVDRLYMSYLQATSGGGGWPMSIFMTPNLEPFFAGTYFPAARFRALVGRIQELWEEDREQCESMGRRVIEQLKEMGSSSRTPSSLLDILSTNPAQKVFQNLSRTYDHRHGGFSPRGPKFPSISNTLEPLARISAYDEENDEKAREMGVRMIRAIWEGGIHDWVGGGVARYSVDERWIVPHFEKMLYDQAQLVSSALDFALLSPSGSEDRKVCFDLAADILEYCLRDLLSPNGGFWSAEDADSGPTKGAKKSEGAFYIWTSGEIKDVLGDDAPIFGYVFAVKQGGNVDKQHDAHGEMTGRNILWRQHSAKQAAEKFNLAEEEVNKVVDRGLKALKKYRDDTRERPGLDDKILTAWNGLMLSALSKSHTSLPQSYPIHNKLLPTARKVVSFLQTEMWDQQTQTLTRSYREGKGPTGQTDDYAFLIQGLLEMYEASGDDEALSWAVRLQERQGELFWDEDGGGWFASGVDEHVLVRLKDSQDGAEPSATSVSAHNLSRLSLLASINFDEYEKQAEATYTSIGEELKQIPRAFGYSVAGLMDLEKGYREFIITGPAKDEMTQNFLELLRGTYMPNKVVIHLDLENPPKKLAELNETVKALLEARDNTPALRVCEGGVCGMPVKDLGEARKVVLGVEE